MVDLIIRDADRTLSLFHFVIFVQRPKERKNSHLKRRVPTILYSIFHFSQFILDNSDSIRQLNSLEFPSWIEDLTWNFQLLPLTLIYNTYLPSILVCSLMCIGYLDQKKFFPILLLTFLPRKLFFNDTRSLLDKAQTLNRHGEKFGWEIKKSRSA